MDGRMTVTRVDVSSTIGDSIWYQHEEDDPIGPFAADGWWHSVGTQHDNIETVPGDGNVVKVNPYSWSEYGFIWPEEHLEQTGNTVVFGNFSKK